MISKPGFFVLSFALVGFVFVGCASEDGAQALQQEQAATIQSLTREIRRLNEQLDQLAQARSALAGAKGQLESELRQEMDSGDLSVSMEDRGLVVTVLDRVLFDSGKAELKESAKITLDKVASILNGQIKNNRIYIEGHTDNVPIRLSAWRSNWELSAARALEVVHYFVEAKGFVPERMAMTGYGEFQPVADNTTESGQSKNRRVEIVISPKKYTEGTQGARS